MLVMQEPLAQHHDQELLRMEGTPLTTSPVVCCASIRAAFPN